MSDNFSEKISRLVNSYHKIDRTFSNICIEEKGVGAADLIHELFPGIQLNKDANSTTLTFTVNVRHGNGAILCSNDLVSIFFTVLLTLQHSKMIKNHDEDIKETITLLKRLNKEKPKKLALELKRKILVIYSSKRFKSVARRWKFQFNINSNALAFNNTFDKACHDLNGFQNAKNAEVIIIRDKNEDSGTKKKVKYIEEKIRRHVKVNEIWLHGRSYLAQIFYGIYFGYLTSIYLAELKDVNPMIAKVIRFAKENF